ncbi:CLUMA_CG018752, isoform A [Clunio marinus]|uniref:CLUMA_CG018752, isoform A n=1 Tax=Clunio marinus TaxID=568069 RepID=A0A1J1J1B0_9DIPT|nr:CLUMA_CG018752, isoform A [Clunio marinus]
MRVDGKDHYKYVSRGYHLTMTDHNILTYVNAMKSRPLNEQSQLKCLSQDHNLIKDCDDETYQKHKSFLFSQQFPYE